MSQNPNQIGEAVIKVRADTSGVLADLESVKPAIEAKVQELTGKGRTFTPGKSGGYELEQAGSLEAARATKATEDATRSATAATREADAASRTFGQTLRDQVAGQRDTISGIRQQIGVVTGLVSAVGAVAGVLGLAAYAGLRMGQALFTTGDSANRLSDMLARVNKQIAEFNKLRDDSLAKKFGAELENTGIAYVARARADEQAKLDAAEAELQKMDESGPKVAARFIETALSSVGLPSPIGIAGSNAERGDVLGKIEDAKERRDALAKQYNGLRAREADESGGGELLQAIQEGNNLNRQIHAAILDGNNRRPR